MSKSFSTFNTIANCSIAQHMQWNCDNMSKFLFRFILFVCWFLLWDQFFSFLLIRETWLDCIHYQALTSGDRRETNDVHPLLCDKDLGPAWFRFLGDAGSKMSSSCVPKHRCGAHASGWLNGTHPTKADGIVTRQVCFTFADSCCRREINVKVRNCGKYFVYFIKGTPPQQRWHLRYCTTDFVTFRMLSVKAVFLPRVTLY